MINLIKHKTPTYSVSIKDKFTTDFKDDCPLISYSIVKVIDKNSSNLIGLADCSNLFDIDSQGVFSVLISSESYSNYLIYVQAENIFGIIGGSDQYLIDLSYKVIPQFEPDFSAMVVLISDEMKG